MYGTMTESEDLPLVTVITPAYNRAEYLGEVIDSVLAQDYPEIEYIVLDDGSTDATPEVMERYDGRIVARSHENIGETQTVNVGLSMARGEIVGVVNSDDPLLPGAIRRVVEALDSNDDVVVVYPDWNMIDSQGDLVQAVHTHDYHYSDMLRWHHCVPGPGAFFRRRIIEPLEGRDPQFRYVADFDFWLRAGLLGPFHRIPETLATFRLHAGGASSTGQGFEMAEEHIRLVEKIFGIADLPKEIRAVRREAFSSAYYIAGVVYGGGSSIRRKRYYLMALLYSPAKYLFEYRDRLIVILRELRAGWRGHLKAGLAALREATVGIRKRQ
jgi:glycosyltransferase involved in cell wall biosynthesis